MKRTILICYLKLKHQIQMYCEFMLKPIDYLFGGFAQAPNILISKESWIFGLKFYPSHWHHYILGVWYVWLEASPQPLASMCPGSLECLGAIFHSSGSWPQPRLHLWESPSKGDPSPERVKITPKSYLNCPPPPRAKEDE